MAERPTSKNTKAEILELYDALYKEQTQLENRIQKLQQEKRELEKGASKAPAGGAAAPSGATPSTLDGVIATLTALRPAFGDAVSELSARLLEEASTLAALRKNVASEHAQLEKLHGLEVTDSTLTRLIQDYSEKSAAFEQERTQHQDAFKQELAEKRKAWQKEQEDHARRMKERDENAKKAEQREAAEYKYDLEHRRQLDRDRYEQQQQQLQQALADFEASQKRAWAEREKRIAEQEQELAELRSVVEKYPKELESAVKKAREEGSAIARRQTKVKADLQAKEAEGERRMYELKIQAFEETIQKQQEQFKNLSKQLETVNKQAEGLALRAIEGASSAGSLQAVKEIALEQARAAQKPK